MDAPLKSCNVTYDWWSVSTLRRRVLWEWHVPRVTYVTRAISAVFVCVHVQGHIHADTYREGRPSGVIYGICTYVRTYIYTYVHTL